MRDLLMRLLLSLLSILGLSRLAEAIQQSAGVRPFGTVKVDVNRVIDGLLADEDIDNDRKITVDDLQVGTSERGDKVHSFVDIGGRGHSVRGTYFLSNLLQELSIAREQHLREADLQWSRIFEPPVNRTSRLIRERFWPGLTRRIDEQGMRRIIADEKTVHSGRRRFLYVPAVDTSATTYYSDLAGRMTSFDLVVRAVPTRVDSLFLASINDDHGLLSLAFDRTPGGNPQPLPFVVPGGRFNEMYGWDSYFEILGLLLDGYVEVSKAMIDHFVYEIRYYGKILNANRTYYLTRSQPPFLTSMIRAVLPHLEPGAATKEWLTGVLAAAIKEHRTVWTGSERLMPSGLSRYWDDGAGPPPEVEPGHFDEAYEEFARHYGMTKEAFIRAYESGSIDAPDVDEYFKDDRAMRESGHDTSYRLTGCAGKLSTVDLNSLLYKTETDLAWILREYFDGKGEFGGRTESSKDWETRAETRQRVMHTLLWDEEAGLFFDWNERERRRQRYIAPTTFYPLWAGLATPEQASRVIHSALPLLEMSGGLAGSSKESRGPVNAERPLRQWDYPFGWAPHQMLAWEGLVRYGHRDIAERLAYRWLYTITRNAVDYNGTIPEKYDVVRQTHDVFAEYGNVGVKFAYITREGFGWMNASYQVGLDLLPNEMKKKLNDLVEPKMLFGW